MRPFISSISVSISISIAALAILAVAGVRPAAQTPFRTSTDVVVIDVSVTDGRRLPITNLTKDDFVVEEGGARREILERAG